MPKSQILGPFPPIENIFFCKKRFSLSFYISKTIEKTLGHLILRTFAIFNPTYYMGLGENVGWSEWLPLGL